ncbi:MAG: transposase [Verrucomicrobiota bacterium]|nr:transposase [Verrucomicrobiota bacterium]
MSPRLFESQQIQWPPDLLRCQRPAAFRHWLRPGLRRPWVVYAKRPFAGPKTVLAYLCRYTHRVGLTNRRLQALSSAENTVSFDYKDYAHGARHHSLTLSLEEFLRRFCLHILPPRFVKLRHYGLLSNRDRPARLAQVRQLLAVLPPQTPPPQATITSLASIAVPPLVCPHCGAPALILVRVLLPPPTPTPPISDTS